MKKLSVKVKPGESKVVPLVWLGNKSEKLEVECVLDKPGSSLKILGVFFGNAHRLELITSVIHRAPNTFSRTIMKGVLDGDAVIDFEGKVLIEKGAKNADGVLSAHAILLSKTSRAILIPQLEVLENEVKAGHGATVGKIDEEQIFYIMSRGLSLEEAKHIIIQGFLGGLLKEFPEKEKQVISKRLNL